ncbi:hypothetical protein GETHLI_30320 [Geothrix limicola]|uniref:Uncharacterized protein n=1 Tax=Geothrix limicola TaxID=2927978 RepID=A0ABQ5QI52_9BACT|nr:hypothetical protein [Geothrix limicola]GLH74530.1 hypothetical protein GETHLI_30320 [Geothrix limicola]
MNLVSTRSMLMLLLACGSAQAWSPKVHEAQTAKAIRLLPRRMAALLRAHPQELLEGARGVANDQPPTVEQVEAQFRTVLRLSDERRRPEEIVRDLGVLAHQVQMLTDPSAMEGVSPLRESFEAYADDHLPHLLVTQEPYWAIKGSLDPGPPLRGFMAAKQERNRRLRECFDEGTGRRIGPWDDLSIPFAQMQLAFSSGVHATANVWILIWRAAGDQWELPAGP